MKKARLILLMIIPVILLASFNKKNHDDSFIAIPPTEQREGDAARGYQYLITGDFLKAAYLTTFSSMQMAPGAPII